MRSVTSILLAADALSSEEAQRDDVRGVEECHFYVSILKTRWLYESVSADVSQSALSIVPQ